MEQLDLTALLARSYEICDALMKADVGNVRSEGRQLDAMLKHDLALFGAYLAEADGRVDEQELAFIRDTLALEDRAPVIAGIRNRREATSMPHNGVPQSIKYAVLSDAGNKLKPDPFGRQAAMIFYDTFKVFGKSVLALPEHDASNSSASRLTNYLDSTEKMLREYAVWRSGAQKSYQVIEPTTSAPQDEHSKEELDEALADLAALVGLDAVKR